MSLLGEIVFYGDVVINEEIIILFNLFLFFQAGLSLGGDINYWKLCTLCSSAPRRGMYATVDLHPTGLGCPSAFSVELGKGHRGQILQ